MKLIPAHYSHLTNRQERAVARLAAMARQDTITGSASALIVAKRADRLKFYSCGRTALEVVSIVYTSSLGRIHPALEAWECPECGSARLGQDEALACCAGHETEGGI